MAWALFILANSAILLGAGLLAERLLPRANWEVRALAVIAGFPLLALPCLTLLGCVGLLHAPGIAALTSSLLLVLWRFHRRQASAPPARAPTSHVVSERLLLGAAAGAVAAAAMPLLYRHLFRPMKFHSDDLSYHAVMPAHWLGAQHLTLAPFDYHAYFPGNAELFTILFVAPSQADAFAALAGLYWLLLAATGGATLARQLGASPALALSSAAIVLLSPPFAGQATAYAAADLAAAALACAATVFLVRLRSIDDEHEFRGRLFYAAGLMGLAGGSKVTYLVPAALALLWVCVCRCSKGWRCLLSNAGGFVLLTVATGGYWYIRNLWLTGNPFFPAELAWFEGPFDRSTQIETALTTQLARLEGAALEQAVEKFLDWPNSVFWLVVVGYCASLIQAGIALCRSKPVNAPVLVVSVLGLGLWLLTTTAPFSGTANVQGGGLHFQLRFFLGVIALGIPLALSQLGAWQPSRAALSWLSMGLVLVLAPLRIALPCMVVGCLVALYAGKWTGLLARLGQGWRRQRRLATSVSVALVAALVFGHFDAKATQDAQARQRQLRRWQALQLLPAGTRVSWVPHYRKWQYYGMFGPRLDLIPVKTEPDGSLYQHLHTNWRQSRPTWWKRAKLGKPGPDYVAALVRHELGAVLLTKRKRQRWGPQYRYLLAAPHAVSIVDNDETALFRLDATR